MRGSRWGASMDLPVTATEEEIREAFSYILSHLSMGILHKGGPGGEWDGKYVNVVPTEMTIKVYSENLDRKISIVCRETSSFRAVFTEGTEK